MSIQQLTQIIQKEERIVIGVMSGTSLDGVDMACVRLKGRGSELRLQLLAFECVSMPDALRQKIRHGFTGTTEQICHLHAEMGRFFGETLGHFLQTHTEFAAQVDLIGLHGQTLFHAHRQCTLQLGDADTVAQMTGIPVVFDFRAADVAAGGSGAPLVPYLDRLLFAAAGQHIALQNIGGIGNVTYLPPNPEAPIIAFDTGPGNAILNELVHVYTNGTETFDRDGKFSAAGTLQVHILNQWLAHPYFKAPLPRSTGREEFGQAFVAAMLKDYSDVSLPDLIRTAVSFTSHSIAHAYRDYLPPLDRIYVSGGGVHHPILMQELRDLLGPVEPLSSHSRMSVDAKEAVAFAVLAHERLNDTPTNVPEVTGANRSVCLGKLALPT